MRKVLTVIFVEFLLYISISDQGRRFRKNGEIGSQGGPVSVDEIKASCLTIKIVGVARLKLLLEVKSGIGIIQGGDR
jgi:hypothetical protein